MNNKLGFWKSKIRVQSYMKLYAFGIVITWSISLVSIGIGEQIPMPRLLKNVPPLHSGLAVTTILKLKWATHI